jgi:hypothetical protein
MNRVNFRRSLITWRGLVLLAGLLWLYVTLSKVTNYRKKLITISETGKHVYLRLIEAGFTPITAQYITAQSAHETANFTSKIFTENHNLFGYTYAGQKIAAGEKSGYALYKNIADSISDYKRYYLLRGYPRVFPSITEFVSTLKRNGYFEAPLQEYISGVKNFHSLYFDVKR